MAVSNVFNTSNTNIKYKITVTEGSVNVANNNSPVTVTVNFYRTNTGYETYGSGTVYCKINGVTYSAIVTSSQKITSSGINLFSATVTIPHNTDGSKTIYVSAWINHSQVTSSEQGFNVTLTTIPRATTPTLSDSTFDMGTSITISTPRASSSFTHTLVCTFGSQVFNIAFNVETSYVWTVPLTLANEIPSATSGVGSITCHTYNGSTLVGSKVTTFVATVPSSIVPIINSVTIDEAVTNPDIKTKFAAFVQHKSKASVLTRATGAYSSTIIGYKVTIRDSNAELLATYIANDVSNISTGTTIVTDILSWNVNQISIGIIITDSRGISASVAYNKTVLGYEQPKVTTFSAYRCDVDGNVDYEGNRIKVTLNYSIAPVNNLNDKYYEVVYRIKGGTSWGALISGNVYSQNTNFVSAAYFNPDYAYDLAVNVYDFFTGTSVQTDIPTAFTLVDFMDSGRGISFGEVASTENFNVALDAVFKGTLKVNSDTVWHSGNDGVGSGLDADKVDGFESNIFTRRTTFTSDGSGVVGTAISNVGYSGNDPHAYIVFIKDTNRNQYLGFGLYLGGSYHTLTKIGGGMTALQNNYGTISPSGTAPFEFTFMFFN